MKLTPSPVTLTGDIYHHTQKGPWGLLCWALAVAFLVRAMYLPVLALQITFLVTGLFLLLLGATLGYLTVENEGGGLAVRFGRLRLFRRGQGIGDGRQPEHP